MADDKRLERMEAKIDDNSDHLAAIDVILKAQHITLQEHMRRTELLEDEFKPMRRKIYMFQGVLAFLGILSTIAGIILVFK